LLAKIAWPRKNAANYDASPLPNPSAANTPGSAAVVEGHLVAVGVRERESAAERPVDGR
jgi:hypothetical protein